MRCTGMITKILGKCTSPAFKDVQIGDEIDFSVPIKADRQKFLYK